MRSGFSLHKITKEYYDAITSLLKNEEGSLLAIEATKGTFDDKIINKAKYYKNLEAEFNAVKNAIREMSERSKIIEKEMNFLTDDIRLALEETGIDEPIICPEFSIKLQKNPPRLVLENEQLIPDTYIVIKEVKSLDTIAIKKDILEGFEVSGARVESRMRVVIK